MLQQEQRFDFKKDLLQVHKPDRRDFGRKYRSDEFVIPNGMNILLPRDSDPVIMTAAKDFCDYLLTSMKLSSMLVFERITEAPCLEVSLNQDLGAASGYMGYRISVTDGGIRLEGYDSKGVAQGLYFLEDLMNLRMAPYLEKRVTARKAVFSPRIVQSPFGMYEYNDECLSIMAHLGYDAIGLWIKDLNTTASGYFIDMKLLCERAERYGISVYISLHKSHGVHPDAPEAEAYYDNMYGRIFRACPKLRGMCVVAESANLAGKGAVPVYTDNVPNVDPNGGYTHVASPDYAKLMAVIQRVVHRINPDVDIILDTYNWGRTPESVRAALIGQLPKGITVSSPWEMYQPYRMGSCMNKVSDYSLRFAKPSDYFVGDARAAKDAGSRLYSTANAAGRTWDFGCAPYEPMPYQWIEKYEALLKAHGEWGLAGLTESIHYGFHPSFISELEKWAFFSPEEDLEEVLRKLLSRDFGEANLGVVDEAMKLWSESVKHCVTSNEDQYGPLRIGPSFPLWVNDDAPHYPSGGHMPFENDAMYKNFMYRAIYFPDSSGRQSLLGQRIHEEMGEISTVLSLLDRGVKLLETISAPNDRLLRLINLGKYLYRTCLTTLHVKQLYVAKQRLLLADNELDAASYVDEIQNILLAEKENVEATIPIVRVDSRLGWEPSMQYVGDEKCLRWKLRQLNFELTITLKNYRDALALTGYETKTGNIEGKVEIRPEDRFC